MSRHVRFHKPPLIPKNEKAKDEPVEVVESAKKKTKPKAVKKPAKKKK